LVRLLFETYLETRSIMIAIQMSINIFILAGALVATFVLGFLFRSGQLASLRRKVIELENEMLANHSEILELQRENASLEQQMKQAHIPVISMKTSRDDKSTDHDAPTKKGFREK
jgi:hypothetical protein